jgi:2-C-methyl-D-erythritol 2,4-cyclodiphosphate synthase
MEKVREKIGGAFEMTAPFKIGFGVDSHRFEEKLSKKKLILGGVHVPEHVGLDSHSDGDVILHAVFNALSSAIGETSIGQFFPDNDPKWKGADSKTFIREIMQRVTKEKYAIGNVVVSLECKRPKIAPIEPKIKHNLSVLLGISESEIAIHATTGEGLTSFGKGEGIYGQAVILLYKAGTPAARSKGAR